MTRARLPLTIKLDHPPASLKKGASAHWRTVRQDFEGVKTAAHYAIRQRLIDRNEWRDDYEPYPALSVEIVWCYWTGRQPDRDNVIARCGAILDAAESVGLVADDQHIEQISVTFLKVSKRGACVAVTFKATETRDEAA